MFPIVVYTIILRMVNNVFRHVQLILMGKHVLPHAQKSNNIMYMIKLVQVKLVPLIVQDIMQSNQILAQQCCVA